MQPQRVQGAAAPPSLEASPWGGHVPNASPAGAACAHPTAGRPRHPLLWVTLPGDPGCLGYRITAAVAIGTVTRDRGIHRDGGDGASGRGGAVSQGLPLCLRGLGCATGLLTWAHPQRVWAEVPCCLQPIVLWLLHAAPWGTWASSPGVPSPPAPRPEVPTPWVGATLRHLFPDASVPNVQVTKLTLMCEQAPGPITMDLTGECCRSSMAEGKRRRRTGAMLTDHLPPTGDLEVLQSRPFVLKEGVDYRVKVSFKVRFRGHLTSPVGSVPLWGSLPTLGTHTAPSITQCPSQGAASQGGVGGCRVGAPPSPARGASHCPFVPTGEQGDRLWAEVPAPDVPPRPAG